MEPRLCLSAVAARPPAGSGVDAVATGNVNGDQAVDVAVASHQNGAYQVTIYSGFGQSDASVATGTAPLVLATIADPFPTSAGPLDVALGDFDDSGISELAISAKDSNEVSLWTFTQSSAAAVDGPLNQPVTPVAMNDTPFVPPGLEKATGLNVAAADFQGKGIYDLVVAPATGGPGKVVVLSDKAGTGWQVVRTIGHIPVKTDSGLSLSAGALTGHGSADIAVGSQADGRVAVYDGASRRWDWTTSPLGKGTKDVRVAIDSSEGTKASGSLVVTGSGASGPEAAIVAWRKKPQMFQLASSPGSGELVPLGAGYVYQETTLSPGAEGFEYSPGPATPAAVFAATGGSQLIIQDFSPAATSGPSAAKFAPSADTYVEPLWGNLGNGFVPMQVQADPDATGQASANTKIPTIDLVVLPTNAYNSPFSIDLSGAPASVTAGLLPASALKSSATSAWGPDMDINTPPTVDSQTTALFLQGRVIAAYASFLGIDYQHHHNPRWSPTEKGSWNATGTLAYQSQGIDCTNFTAAAYADALGIKLPGDTTKQGEVTSNSDITLPTNSDDTPNPIDNWINAETFSPSAWGNTYDGLVKFLKPGDIIFIDGKKGGNITHAITWLGPFGKDANNMYSGRLIIDSTGITPQHVDSNNMIIPEGVHIRPFLYAGGDASAPNGWYFNDVDHVLRIINPPT